MNKVSFVKGELFVILFYLGFVRKFGIGRSFADHDDSFGRTPSQGRSVRCMKVL